MSTGTGSAVARLMSRLDAMPLAIELAAARVEALGAGPLLDRLDGQFDVLAGARRRAPARHRSLTATVEWSYQLLREEERRVFRRLSVFPGPFTLEAAEAVAGGRCRAGGAAPGRLFADRAAPRRPRRAAPLPDARDPARLRDGPACRNWGAARCGRRAHPACTGGGWAGRGRPGNQGRGLGNAARAGHDRGGD